VTAFLTLVGWLLENRIHQLYHFRFNWVSPRGAESEFGSGILGSFFGWGFNGRSEGITQQTGIFPVGVVDAPQFVFGRRRQIHGD
jgi:hypothetical protein